MSVTGKVIAMCQVCAKREATVIVDAPLESQAATIATLQRQLDMAKNPTEATPASLDRSVKLDRDE